MSTPDSSPLEALERFIAENDDLLKLEEMIGRFNVFDALGVARAEIRHSNFLAWLLDPAESHGHGDLFLKAVVMDLLRQTPPELRPISPVELDGVELGKVVVRREWPANLDLCISCGSPCFVIAIENKVDAGEHGDQLGKYDRAVAQQFPGVKVLRVFLTRDGAEASDPSWCSYTYADVYRVLSRVQRMFSSALGGDVGVFLSHYLNLIGSQFMDNPDIVELCRRIYTNHRRAIDLINTHAPVSGSEALAPIAEWLQSRPTAWQIRTQNVASVAFIPQSWVGTIFRSDGSPSPTTPCDMWLECQRWGDQRIRVSTRLVIGPGADQAKRQRLIEQLMSKDYGLERKNKGRELSDRFTRLSSKTLAEWPVDSEVPAEKLAAEFSSWLARLEPVLVQVPKLVSVP